MRGPINRGQRSAEVSLPAPVGGWNARDALAAMPPTDAVTLDNLFPRPDRIVSRGGTSSWSTGLGGSVDSLMEWAGLTSRKLLGIANNSIFDCSSQGAVGAALATGLTNSQWQHTMITTPGGAFLVLANGADAVQNYDGASLTTPSITGVTSSTLTNPNLYRGRVFFIIKNSLKVAYLPLNSIAGAASIFDLGQFCKRGGYMVAMGTWTRDGGESGQDDMAVFLTSEGEVLIYQGSDPSTAGSFQIVGIFQCGKPLGNRPMHRFGADLLLILEDGVYPVSALIQEGVTNPALALSDKVRSALADAANLFGSTFGWQATYFPILQRLIVNVPQDTTGTTYYQFVMNALPPRAWCRYTNWNARSWSAYGSQPYYGDSSGNVWKAETLSTDNGAAIVFSARQAFSDLGVPGCVKHVKMMRARMRINGVKTTPISLDADVDYAQTNLTPSPPSAQPLGYWNVGLWNKCYWSVGQQSQADWQTVGAIGTVIAPRFAAAVSGAVDWYGTDIVAEAGSIL